MHILAQPINGITVTVSQVLTVCITIISAAFVLFGAIYKLQGRLGKIETTAAVNEQKIVTMQSAQDSVGTKLENVLNTLNQLNSLVAALAERTSHQKNNYKV